jgi:FKBP-type peptidyl-prolyl cis-trans isomerase
MMKRASLSILAILLLLPAAQAGEAKMETDHQKTIYALGLVLSERIAVFQISEQELEFLTAGLSDGILGSEPKVDLAVYGPKINSLAMTRSENAAELEKAASVKYLEMMAKEKGIVRRESGLLYKEIKAGTGESPSATDTVKVHYHGTLRDGTVFDSSVDRGAPAEFPLNGVIKCWTEGVQLMKVGGKSKLVCPADIAYGDRGAPPKIKPGAALVFLVELLDIVKKGEKPQE